MRRRIDDSGFGADVAIPSAAFNVEGGLTFLPVTWELFKGMLDAQNFTEAPALTAAGPNTIQIAFYVGVPAPEGATTTPFATAMQSASAQIATSRNVANWVRVVDKTVIAPTPGVHSIVFTVDPKVVADLAKVGGTHYLMYDEVASPTVAMARTEVANRALAASKAGTVTLATVAAVAGAAVLLAVGLAAAGHKGRGRRHART
jgi:hypothetical protein